MKVADLGMGWGFGAAYMATHSNVEVVGVTLSKEQVKWAKANVMKKGLRISFVLEDYRDHCLDPARIGTYDRVYSIGMFEHVGYKNHKGFFQCIRRLLKPDGLAVVHTIGEPDFVPNMDPFLDKYIFPGAVIPSLSSITLAYENDFILEDMHNFGYDYSRTLAAWTDRANQYFADGASGAAHAPEFKRMWLYYLGICEALFELRINQLWQFVLSPRPTSRKGIQRQI
jgi:cyclopropane-fatty-acyl-phospholipid synthase